MKTLILNGSPRINGDTAALLAEMKKHLAGEIIEVSAYHGGISPCVDCRHCWRYDGCAIKDGMQPVYEAIQDSDNLVIASPVYYSQLTGPLLSLVSRFQCYYAARRFRGVRPAIRRKHGVLVLVGGGDGSPKPAEDAADILFRQLNAQCVGTVLSLKTDETPAGQDKAAVGQARELAIFLTTLYKDSLSC